VTDPAYRHITFVMDRSSSMQAVKQETEQAFAGFLAEQRPVPGRVTVSLYEFDHEQATVYEMTDLAATRLYRLVPRGNTALLDAIGRAVTRTGRQLAVLPEQERPGTVIVVVLTDGKENASTRWGLGAIRDLIERQQQLYSWTFVFLGADQDAIAVGNALWVSSDTCLSYTGEHTGAALRSTSDMLTRGSATGYYGFTNDERHAADGTGS
jgi:Mg-chelatase subunit ChlD